MLFSHPTRSQLIQYAEAIVEGKGPIYSGIARHLKQCTQCASEVDAICTSLRFCHSRGVVVEPPKELTFAILSRTKQQRKQSEYLPRRYQRFSTIGAVVCVMTWVVIGLLLLWRYEETLVNGTELSKYSVRKPQFDKVYSLREDKSSSMTGKRDKIDMRKELEILGSVLQPLLEYSRGKSDSRLHYMAIIDKDLQSAEYALKRNPGCSRAQELLERRMREKAEVLKWLYWERVL